MGIKKMEYTKSSGNVYQDMRFADAETRLVKARLVMRIEEIINKNGFKQIEAAEMLDINQPKISALMNGRLSGFSIERLIHFLSLLNQDVEIHVKNKPARRKAQGHLKVAFG